MNLESREYPSVRFGVMNNLCADVILGHEFMRNHKEVVFTFGGRGKALNISKKSCNVLPARVNKARNIFLFVDSNVKPIATRSREFKADDSKFVKSEVDKLQKDGIIELSQSPWRAQALIARDSRHKKGLLIDHSKTINQ